VRASEVGFDARRERSVKAKGAARQRDQARARRRGGGEEARMLAPSRHGGQGLVPSPGGVLPGLAGPRGHGQAIAGPAVIAPRCEAPLTTRGAVRRMAAETIAHPAALSGRSDQNGSLSHVYRSGTAARVERWLINEVVVQLRNTACARCDAV
jgi:hypothetical protein